MWHVYFVYPTFFIFDTQVILATTGMAMIVFCSSFTVFRELKWFQMLKVRCFSHKIYGCFKGVLHSFTQSSMFCALPQNNQHLLEK